MLGKRYGLLPSEVLTRATTFDLQCLDISISYERYKNTKADNSVPQYKEQDLLKAVEAVKKRK